MPAAPRPRRVGLVTPYYRPVVGGITTFVGALAEQLADVGAEVTILTGQGEPGDGVRVGPPDPSGFVKWCRAELMALRPDVIHAHAHWYCLAPAFSPAGARLAPRVVFTVHTRLEIRSPLRKLALRRLLKRADAVTFVSERSRAEFTRRFGTPTRLEVVYPGARLLSRAGPPADREVGGFHVASVSMMVWPEKVRGLRVLLDAFAILRRELPKARLTLVGGGELGPQLEAYAADLGLVSAVTFAGIVPDPGEIIASSDVVCHISFQDSLAQSVLEALALGVPVLANEGVFSDEIAARKDIGIIHCPATPTAIARELARIASDGDLRRLLGAQGAAFVKRHFSWPEQGRRFWELYGFGDAGSRSR